MENIIRENVEYVQRRSIRAGSCHFNRRCTTYSGSRVGNMAEKMMAFTMNNVPKEAATVMSVEANMAPQSV